MTNFQKAKKDECTVRMDLSWSFDCCCSVEFFLLHIKKIPTLTLSRRGCRAGSRTYVSNMLEKKIRSSIGEDTRQAWKEIKTEKLKIENVESPSSEPQPFDTAVNLRLLWLLLVINNYYYYNEIARRQLEAYFIEKRKGEGEREKEKNPRSNASI